MKEYIYNRFLEQLDNAFEEGSDYECGCIDFAFEDKEFKKKIEVFVNHINKYINKNHDIRYYSSALQAIDKLESGIYIKKVGE